MVEPKGDDPLPSEQEDDGETEGTIIELKQQRLGLKQCLLEQGSNCWLLFSKTMSALMK